MRQGDGLIEPGGQFRFDFEAAEGRRPEPALPAGGETLPAVADVESHPASAEEMCRLAAELEEEGQLPPPRRCIGRPWPPPAPAPKSASSWPNCSIGMGDLPAARERYYMAIELDEDYVEARANLGCVLAETGQRELAVAAFEGALRYHAGYADAHYHLARTLDDTGPPRRGRGALAAVLGHGAGQPLGGRRPHPAGTVGPPRRGLMQFSKAGDYRPRRRRVHANSPIAPTPRRVKVEGSGTAAAAAASTIESMPPNEASPPPPATAPPAIAGEVVATATVLAGSAAMSMATWLSSGPTTPGMTSRPSRLTVPERPTLMMPLVGKAAASATSIVPSLMVVPPVYVSLPERINTPPPLRVTLAPVPVWLMGPEMVKRLPVVALTLRLLPSTTGTAMVWLPPLSAIETFAVPLLSVNVLAVSPPLRLMV